VLSQDAAGCAAVAEPAKRESDAWRTRFVQACPGLASPDSVVNASANLDYEDIGDTGVRTRRLGNFSVYTTQLSSPIYVDVIGETTTTFNWPPGLIIQTGVSPHSFALSLDLPWTGRAVCDSALRTLRCAW
jgi:hypothetical protein